MRLYTTLWQLTVEEEREVYYGQGTVHGVPVTQEHGIVIYTHADKNICFM